MLPGAPKFGFGVPGPRTRVQDWKSFEYRPLDAESTVAMRLSRDMYAGLNNAVFVVAELPRCQRLYPDVIEEDMYYSGCPGRPARS